jgi:hypothetical protein
MRVKRGLVAAFATVTLGLAAFASGTADVAAQECHSAYGPCLPIVYDLNCEDIGWAVVQVLTSTTIRMDSTCCTAPAMAGPATA